MKPQRLAVISYREALDRWRAALAKAGTPVCLDTEVVPLHAAAGRIPAVVLRTKYAAPFHAAAAMDGYALRAQELADATPARPVELLLGRQAIPVDTGSAMPGDCNAVVPWEEAQRTGDRAIFSAPVACGEHVRLPGEDIPPGVVAGRPGTPLRPLDCAVLAASGAASVAVVRRPRVTVIPSGSELIAPGAAPAAGTAFESNSTLIAGAAALLGAQCSVTAVIPDDPRSLQAALQSAASQSDLIVLLGGSSRGRRDQSCEALKNVGDVVVSGVATRPARPVNLGLIGAIPVINLPGYPVACHLAFKLYAEPLIRRLAGYYEEETGLTVSLAAPLKAEGDADEWHPVNLEPTRDEVSVIPGDPATQGLYSVMQSDALLHVPCEQTLLPKGISASVTLLRPIERATGLVFIGPYDPLIEELAALMHFRCHWQSEMKASAAKTDEQFAPGPNQLRGLTNVDLNGLQRELQQYLKVEFAVLGRRSEGRAVRRQPAGMDGRPAAADAGATAAGGGRLAAGCALEQARASAWRAAAAVAAGLAPAAPSSAYVAHCFDLELLERHGVWYGMLWHSELQDRKRWSVLLGNALQKIRPAAEGLGWEWIAQL